VTTRSVALAAGVQPPTIYRLFGDKDGLLDAVAEHGFAHYAANKRPADPITAAVTLRAALPDLTTLTPHERALLGDWLDRVTDS
jgi:AcrR family transcriptional regulator